MVADGIALEQTVIGHALNDSVCYQLFLNDVDWGDFSAPQHRVIAYCLKRISELGIRRPDEDSLQLVINSFPENDKDYGGAEYIRSLKDAFLEKTENYKQFVDRLRINASKSRILTKYIPSIIKAANNPNSTIDDLRSIVRVAQNDIESSDGSSYSFKDMSQLSVEYDSQLTLRLNRQFYTTGFVDLDSHLTEGFAPKCVSILAGFTGMAKSTVVVNMAHRIAVQGIGVAIFSMESTDISLFDKIISTLTQIPVTRLKKEVDQLTDSERNSIKNAAASIENLPLLISDQASVSIDLIRYQIELAMRKGYDLKVIFIDLFGKVEDVDTGENLATRIQRECKRMRVLAKELGVHFVLVVQVGRQGFGIQKGGKVKRPTLIDIKNANAYAEEADIVLLLHRNKYYIPELDDDILEIDIAKQRDGEANTRVYFELFADTSTIMDTEKLPHDAGAQ